ncbi:glycosyltransferase family 90 [Trichoderma arundinaceum]|uniref:Glycosyltransferase family 90 n=1 Tax=Trichoderma arundinaceum TaxID=490622 RepID=A0A395NE37_TRIAR|nr:glycosyltransferase family 90 [Trichoderma arundinaceum]
MKFTLAILAITTLFSAAEACKCWANGDHVPDLTRPCCSAAGGYLNQGNTNCDGIGENLSSFWYCCKSYGAKSDCNCPTCWGVQDGVLDENNDDETAPWSDWNQN